jgi:hypothetical protein
MPKASPAPLYEKLFVWDLKVPEGFLYQHRDVIRERLKRAADELARDHGNIFAINMCLHAASSIVLSHPDYLGETLNAIRRTSGLEKEDPSTVLTVSALFYLIQWDARRAESERQSADSKSKSDEAVLHGDRLRKLRSGFDKINWMVGEDAMRVLGLTKVG